MKTNNLTIGIIGAGKLGIVLGNLAVNAGYKVYLSTSRPKEEIQLIIDILVPGGVAATNREISEVADVIILALPLGKYTTLDSNMFAGKIVLDAMNYWWEVDGVPNLYSDETLSSSERVALHFNKSKVVKAFNHIGYHNLADYAKQSSNDNRKAVLYATDYQEIRDIIENIISDFGFTPLSIGQLKNGKILETGEPLFGATLAVEEIVPIVKKALNK